MYHLGLGDADGGEQRLEQAGKRRFAHPAQAQRGQRNAQLAGRQVGIELAVHLAEDAPAQPLRLGNCPYPGFTQRDNAEFGRHKESIERDQE